MTPTKTSLFVAAALVISCSRAPNTHTDTVNLQQSSVKWQSIGNCWLYATVGWAEALVLKNTGQALDLSESYLTYRHWERELLSYLPTELETGGSFADGLSLLGTYGIMREGDFIPAEANEPKSQTQKDALAYINGSLKSGRLAGLRAESSNSLLKIAVIREELNTAFHVDMQTLQNAIIPAANLLVGRTAEGFPISLARVAADPQFRWTLVPFPTDWRTIPTAPYHPQQFPLTAAQQSVLRRTKRALNDGYPVVLSWFVDLNALQGTSFSLENLQAAGDAGRQGGHLTVIEDYVVSGTNPASGEHFQIGEGDVDALQKRLAAEFGNIDYFVVKNSWGQKPDLSYFRDGTYGYHKILASYLFSWLPQTRSEESREIVGVTPAVRGFVLPPSY